MKRTHPFATKGGLHKTPKKEKHPLDRLIARVKQDIKEATDPAWWAAGVKALGQLHKHRRAFRAGTL